MVGLARPRFPASDLFPLLRALVDADRRNGRFLLLGSASPALLKQSSESLAGRISYVELTPFFLPEVDAVAHGNALRHLWLRGGYPLSYLVEGDSTSLDWRNDFKRTLLERDIRKLGTR
jgi:predicted AAA+ superfamily ATPase